jgi:predicted nucleotidyltransferase
MRLTENQILAINQIAKVHFGNSVKVYLFGSRVDNNRKGGDIDLLIKSNQTTLLTLKNKILFLIDLKSRIGERKIDVVFDIKNKYSGNFLDSIKKQSVKLC